jgi:hypothetical protein
MTMAVNGAGLGKAASMRLLKPVEMDDGKPPPRRAGEILARGIEAIRRSDQPWVTYETLKSRLMGTESVGGAVTKFSSLRRPMILCDIIEEWGDATKQRAAAGRDPAVLIDAMEAVSHQVDERQSRILTTVHKALETVSGTLSLDEVTPRDLEDMK